VLTDNLPNKGEWSENLFRFIFNCDIYQRAEVVLLL
jgi:hypothetical protein